jgi:hypothetical protein
MKTRLGTPVNNIFSARGQRPPESLAGRALTTDPKRSCEVEKLGGLDEHIGNYNLRLLRTSQLRSFSASIFRVQE